MAQPALHIDFETRSTIDLPASGVYGYALADTTDILCMAYGFDGEKEVKIWKMGEPCPSEVVEHIKSGGILKAYNANFERIMWKGVAHRRYGWPLPKNEQFDCVMVRALAMGFPGKLELVAPAIGLTTEKDMAGARLMMQMCRPRSIRPLTWWEDEARLKRLYEYCIQDVIVERDIDVRLLNLSDKEHEVYTLDQKINDRGVYVDAELCLRAEKIVKDEYDALDQEMMQVTRGKVKGCAAVQQIINFLRNRGVDTDSVNKETVVDLLGKDDLPDDCRRVLEIRRESAKASVAKIHSMLTRMTSDRRLRGNLQFYGASATGRWAARGTQLQNLPRPQQKDIDGAIRAIMTGDRRRVRALYGSPLSVVSDCIRSMITAGENNELIASDFANIEGRVNAFLAGQKDKIKMFAEGKPIYEIMASVIFSVPLEQVTKDSFERQVGKAAELGCGYGMGAEKFRETCRKAGIIISLEESQRIVKAWREANDRIVEFWNGAEKAAVSAVQNPGKTFTYGLISYKTKGSFLFCKLPSGRLLCYPYPCLREKEPPWSRKTRAQWFNVLLTHEPLPAVLSDTPKLKESASEAAIDNALGLVKAQLIDNQDFLDFVAANPIPEKETKVAIVHKGVDTFTRKWTEISTYGGKLVENIVQATARDIMAEAMLRLEAAGYRTVLTVHDEIICEVPKGFGESVWSDEAHSFYDPQFDRIMAEVPDWAIGCPIAASGWRGKRYRK